MPLAYCSVTNRVCRWTSNRVCRWLDISAGGLSCRKLGELSRALTYGGAPHELTNRLCYFMYRGALFCKHDDTRRECRPARVGACRPIHRTQQKPVDQRVDPGFCKLQTRCSKSRLAVHWQRPTPAVQSSRAGPEGNHATAQLPFTVYATGVGCAVLFLLAMMYCALSSLIGMILFPDD